MTNGKKKKLNNKLEKTIISQNTAFLIRLHLLIYKVTG